MFFAIFCGQSQHARKVVQWCHAPCVPIQSLYELLQPLHELLKTPHVPFQSLCLIFHPLCGLLQTPHVLLFPLCGMLQSLCVTRRGYEGYYVLCVGCCSLWIWCTRAMRAVSASVHAMHPLCGLLHPLWGLFQHLHGMSQLPCRLPNPTYWMLQPLCTILRYYVGHCVLYMGYFILCVGFCSIYVWCIGAMWFISSFMWVTVAYVWAVAGTMLAL